MSEFPLRLENYFFTHQEAIANPEFLQDAAKKPYIDLVVNGGIVRLDDSGNESRYGVTVHVELNKEKSENSPYFFSITAFGIVSIKTDMQSYPGVESLVETSGTQLLFGAIRERLADMTSRGPWSFVQLDFIPLVMKLDS